MVLGLYLYDLSISQSSTNVLKCVSNPDNVGQFRISRSRVCGYLSRRCDYSEDCWMLEWGVRGSERPDRLIVYRSPSSQREVEAPAGIAAYLYYQSY